MAVDETLSSSFIDGCGPHWSGTRIFGHRLRKLCLWHILLLKTLDSPFMRAGVVTMFDLRVAVGVCRLRYGDSRVRKPWLVPALLPVWHTLTWPFRRKPQDGALNARQRSLQRMADAFAVHAADYTREPDYAIIPPSSSGTPQTKRGRAPDEAEHVAELVNWTGWDEATIWEMPVSMANWYRMFARRFAGHDVDFTTTMEKLFQQQLKQQQEKKNA